VNISVDIAPRPVIFALAVGALYLLLTVIMGRMSLSSAEAFVRSGGNVSGALEIPFLLKAFLLPIPAQVTKFVGGGFLPPLGLALQTIWIIGSVWVFSVKFVWATFILAWLALLVILFAIAGGFFASLGMALIYGLPWVCALGAATKFVTDQGFLESR